MAGTVCDIFLVFYSTGSAEDRSATIQVDYGSSGRVGGSVADGEVFWKSEIKICSGRGDGGDSVALDELVARPADIGADGEDEPGVLL